MVETKEFKEIKQCRACSSELEEIFDFGQHEIISFGDKPAVKSPLDLVLCKSCHLVQLKHTVNPDLLFRKYYYKSGINQTMRNHLWEIAETTKNKAKLQPRDIFLDIGANDGTLLQSLSPSIITIGFEPSQLQGLTHYWVKDYFSADAYFAKNLHQAKAITALSMFYDLDDPGKFLDDVKQVLAPDGLFVLEMNYLVPMLENNRVDNISAEHLCYYSFSTLAPLLATHGLDIVDVQFDEINGGVFRVYCKHGPSDRDIVIPQHFPHEENLDKIETYHKFVKRVLKNMAKLNEFISEKQDYESIDVLAASTRGLTVMQLANLGPKKIRQVVERMSSKVGTKYNGIEVVSEETMRKKPPNYLLILAGITEQKVGEFIQREADFLLNGGKMIIAFPEPAILRLDSI